MALGKPTSKSVPVRNFEPIHAQLSTLSIPDLAASIDVLAAQSAAAEAVLNQPRLRDRDGSVVHDLLDEADSRLEAVARELRSRRPVDEEESDARFRGLLRYASLTCAEPEGLEEMELTRTVQ